MEGMNTTRHTPGQISVLCVCVCVCVSFVQLIEKYNCITVY